MKYTAEKLYGWVHFMKRFAMGAEMPLGKVVTLAECSVLTDTSLATLTAWCDRGEILWRASSAGYLLDLESVRERAKTKGRKANA